MKNSKIRKFKEFVETIITIEQRQQKYSIEKKKTGGGGGIKWEIEFSLRKTTTR